MGKWGGSVSPHSFNPPTCLQDSCALSKFASILDKASVISTLQHMVCATPTPPTPTRLSPRAQRPLSQYILLQLLQDSSKIKAAVKEGFRETRNSWSRIHAVDTSRRRWKSGLFYHIHTEQLPHMVGENSVALFVADSLLCVTHYAHIQHGELLPPALPFFFSSHLVINMSNNGDALGEDCLFFI